eukprot:TRINITY_DN47126_c0_g1_i1.p1 TRINITY_DN47126_c0_g1~~TRINITY_DN47126_c0_g1_i1.p1  ORF type:complete len:1159 (-),score=337.49 TRINITY_DN47126_c0_g1_i1:161-3637(-)
MEAIIEKLKQCISGRKTDDAIDWDSGDNPWALNAPIDDEAALRLLTSYHLVNDLEAEWPEPDEGWLDRIVIGKLIRKPGHGTKESRQTYLGFLLSSNAAPMAAVTGGKERTTAMDGTFLWLDWSAKYPDLRVDYLHLLPLTGSDLTPVESIDLGKLTTPPTLVGRKDQTFDIVLDYGTHIEELLVCGQQQGSRWVSAVRASLLSTLTSAAEIEESVLIEALEHHDKHSVEMHGDEAHHMQHTLIESFARSLAEGVGGEEGLEWHASLPDKVEQLLRYSLSEIPLIELIEVLEKVPIALRVVVTAAVRHEPPRVDILEFWRDHYHISFCASLQAVWQQRVKVMTASELEAFATVLHRYRSWLSSVYIQDPSLGTALEAVASVFSRRSAPSLGKLAENVADIAKIRRLRQNSSALCTTAPLDMLHFLGSVSEVALQGPEEMQAQAAKVIDSTLQRYVLRWKERLKCVEALQQPGLFAMYVAALLMDAEEFSIRIEQMVLETQDEGSVCGRRVLNRLAGRFRSSADIYCERLVSIAFEQTGAAKEFGVPTASEKVCETDLKQLIADVFCPVIKAFQDMLGEPWRSRFVVRFLSRFLAFELYALLFLPRPSAVSMEQLAERLRQQRRDIAEGAAAAGWLSSSSHKEEEMQAQLERQLDVLTEFAALLTAPPANLRALVTSTATSRGIAFSKELLRRLLDLRDDASEAERESLLALLQTPALDQSISMKAFARNSFVAMAADPNLVDRRSMACGVLEWLEDVEKLSALMPLEGDGKPSWPGDDWLTSAEAGLEMTLEDLQDAAAAAVRGEPDPLESVGKTATKKERRASAANIADFLGDLDSDEDDEDDDDDDTDDDMVPLEDPDEPEAPSHSTEAAAGDSAPQPPADDDASAAKKDTAPSTAAVQAKASEKPQPLPGGKRASKRTDTGRHRRRTEVETEMRRQEEESEDEDDFVRGYLDLHEDIVDTIQRMKHARKMSHTGTNILDRAVGGVVGGVMAGAEAGLQAAHGGWTKRFFQVQRDMRGNCSLCWYNELGDLAALGSVQIAEMGKISTSKDEKANCLIEIEVLDVRGEKEDLLRLRTGYESERDLWMSQLTKLQQREAESESFIEARTDLVMKMDGHLNISDPERLGVQVANMLTAGAKKPFFARAMDKFRFGAKAA